MSRDRLQPPRALGWLLAVVLGVACGAAGAGLVLVVEAVSRPMTKYLPPIARPQVAVERRPDGLWDLTCLECPHTEGPSVKTYVQERAVAHRKAHRAGAVRA